MTKPPEAYKPEHPEVGMVCPKCGSDVWDNAEKKAAGTYKPTAPDLKCKNRDCDWKEWPEKDKPARPA